MKEKAILLIDRPVSNKDEIKNKVVFETMDEESKREFTIKRTCDAIFRLIFVMATMQSFLRLLLLLLCLALCGAAAQSTNEIGRLHRHNPHTSEHLFSVQGSFSMPRHEVICSF